MLKHLRRWHFDGVLFLGLALFSWAYWYSKPQPRWSSALPKDQVSGTLSIMGVSNDGQRLLTFNSSATFGLSPRIQHWDITTGKLISDHELQLNELERRYVSQGDVHLDHSGGFILEECQSLLLCSSLKRKYWRLFDLQGRPIGAASEGNANELVSPLTTTALPNSQWPAAVHSLAAPFVAKIQDLNSGNDLHVFVAPDGFKCSSMHLFPDQQHVGIFWSELPSGPPLAMSQKKWRLLYDVYALNEFRHVTSTELPSSPVGYIGMFIPIGDNSFAYPYLVKQQPRLEFKYLFYQFDPTNGTFLPSTQHPLYNFRSQPGEWLLPMPPYFFNIRSVEKVQTTGLDQQIKKWLALLGLYREGPPRTNIEVCDLATGQPLRQLNDVPSAFAKLSPDGRFTVGVEGNTIHLYDVPHHLWTKSLSWLQWLGWGLVFLWPLRYLKPPLRTIPVTPAANS